MTEGEDPAQSLCFTARALAQTHPLSKLVYDYRRSFIDKEIARQPNKDFVDWASNCVLVGYCLRRVEESLHDLVVQLHDMTFLELSERASAVASEITMGTDKHFIGDPSSLVAALDRLISTELDKRWETAKDHASAQDWEVLEEYLSWAVIHGYCLRVVETTDVCE